MKYVEEEMSMFEFAERFLSVNDMDSPQQLDISALEIEVESMMSNGDIGWAPMSSYIVKEPVEKHWQLGSLKGSSTHRVLYKGEWVELQNHPEAQMVDEPLCIVDMSVEETQNYVANGQINHNTTPGGKAIPFHSSVRIKLGAGQPIKDKAGDVIGINVSAKTIKNKVAAPFRSCRFQIHFGKGIFEDEELFDVVRKGGEHLINGKNVEVSGTGSWKHFAVTDATTGEVELERKFYKKDFGALYDDPEVSEWLELLTEKIFVKNMSDPDAADVDADSYVEVQALSDNLVGDMVDPEVA